MISDQIIFKETGQYDKEVVQHLRLSRMGLVVIGNIERCISLIELDLSRNEIASIGGLATLSQLQILNLSFNKISRIENLSNLACLEALDIRGNQLRESRDIEHLATVPALKSLFLRGVDGEDANPICNNTNYPSLALDMLPDLQLLDGGHCSILASFNAMEEQLREAEAKGSAESEASASIAPEPWFSPKDLNAVIDASIIIDRYIKNNKVFEGTLEAQNVIHDMLAQDCGHLIRKAQKFIEEFCNKDLHIHLQGFTLLNMFGRSRKAIKAMFVHTPFND